MKAKILLLVTQEDGCWGALAEKYNEDYRIEDVLELARQRYQEVMRENDNEVCGIEGEIQDETNEHILTWEDGIGEVMRIYKK